MLTVVVAILAKLVVILKLGLMSVSKRIKLGGHGNNFYAMTKKRNMFQSPINVSACSHVKSISFATFFLKCFVAETKKNSNQFGFFLFVSAAEILCCK